MHDGPLLIAGLGNPGEAYARHRHNIGFITADAIHAQYRFGPWRTRFHGMLAEGMLPVAGGGRKTLLLKPMTYMNESGRALAEAMRFYKLALSDLAVIHDEVDLAPLKVRVKTGGGDAGHNGLRSITAAIGADYRRVRIGVGHPGVADLVPRYVLRDIPKADWKDFAALIDAVVAAAPLLAAGDDAGFMNKVALLTKPAKPADQKPRPAARKETKPDGL